jgi:hypothetical protein
MHRSCRIHGEKRNDYSMLVGKLEGKRPLRRPICRLENNIKTNLGEIQWGNMD